MAKETKKDEEFQTFIREVVREKCELCGAVYTAYNNRQTNLMDNCVKCDRKFCEDCRHVEETTDDPWCNECAEERN